MSPQATLGIDIGKVIIAGENSADTSFLGSSLEDALRTPPMPGCFDAILQLNQIFEGRVWLVSKARPNIQSRTRVWLERQAFWSTTGVPRDHLRFCRERREKAEICARLGVTHFIDDRADVLRHLAGIVPFRYLFGPQKSHGPMAGVASVMDWDDALPAVLRDLTPEGGLPTLLAAPHPSRDWPRSRRR